MIKKIVAVSGGFDPLHVGHIRMFKEAAKYGDLYVILNSDNFLISKKSYTFMSHEERKEIIKSIRYVKDVIDCIDKDQSVCKTLEKLKPDIFCNGGDRFTTNTLEVDICKKLGIKMKFNVGGDKIQSSSILVNKRRQK